MIRIALLGSTGSIGTQVAEVVRRYPDQFRIVSIAANRNVCAFLQQVQEFRPEVCALSDEDAAKEVAPLLPQGVTFLHGKTALEDAASVPSDVLFVAVTGFRGLSAVLKGLHYTKRLALANKETLVSGGALVTALAQKLGVEIAPVDSEHSAVWQALGCKFDVPFEKIILTASGGPFRGYTARQLESVTVQQALKHPNWDMGAKITIDSATLMNKGLEVIEASWLFRAPAEKIDVVVHPESIVHSMVQFEDGAVLAQMGTPTMEVPIQLALTYPNRWKMPTPRVDFAALGKLTFEKIDAKTFRCFDLALSALKSGGDRPACLNAANEQAVQLFLEGKISFTDIAKRVERALETVPCLAPSSYENVQETDRLARLSVLR